MLKEQKKTRLVLFSLILFAAIGISLATETMSRLGLADSYIYIISLAFLVAALLVGKKPVIVGVVLIGVVVINLPEAALGTLDLDRDMVLALVCAIIIAPSVYELITN